MSPMMAGLSIQDSSKEPRQTFDKVLDEGNVPEQDTGPPKASLREIFEAIDPDDIAELREKNRNQADL